jgi:riboflavin synthase
MFTGLVEGQGALNALQTLPSGLRLSIAPQSDCFLPGDVAVGDSICISGCCLTVVATDAQCMDFEAGEETLSKTNLGELKPGQSVNLERSLAVGDRLGGHFVQGHVDGTACVSRIDQSDEWVDMWFQAPADLLRLMVPKGSIAIDGISLTIVELQSDCFSVALIPHTLNVTTLGHRSVGNSVNIENDVLGKYVDRLLQCRTPNTESGAP